MTNEQRAINEINSLYSEIISLTDQEKTLVLIDCILTLNTLYASFGGTYKLIKSTDIKDLITDLDSLQKSYETALNEFETLKTIIGILKT